MLLPAIHPPGQTSDPSTPSLTSQSTASSIIASPTTPETQFEATTPKSSSRLTVNMSEPDSRSESQSESRPNSRCTSELVAHGYEPVWDYELGYPGDIPSEIAEYLYPALGRCVEIVGPLSSIFWLIGAEFLNELIDDPAYILQDEIRILPHARGNLWIVQALYDEDKIPGSVMKQIDLLFNYGIGQDSLVSSQAVNHSFARNSPIPSAISTSSQEQRVTDLFSFARTDLLPSTIFGLRAKWDKNIGRLETTILSKLTAMNTDQLLFKGISRPALVSLMTVFCPIISNNNLENEFGPGFYTVTSLNVALHYSGPSGVLLVFDRPPIDSLRKLPLSGEDWLTTIRFWTNCPVGDLTNRVPAPSLWNSADILEGPISTAAGGRNARRVEGSDQQVVGVSANAFREFASALKMVIWFE